MKRIFKYKLLITDEQVLSLPLGSKVLSAIEQYDDVVLYVMVETEVKSERKVVIKIVGTGHPIDFNFQTFKFLNSVSTHGGRLIWHVFFSE